MICDLRSMVCGFIVVFFLVLNLAIYLYKCRLVKRKSATKALSPARTERYLPECGQAGVRAGTKETQRADLVMLRAFVTLWHRIYYIYSLTKRH